MVMHCIKPQKMGRALQHLVRSADLDKAEVPAHGSWCEWMQRLSFTPSVLIHESTELLREWACLELLMGAAP